MVAYYFEIATGNLLTPLARKVVLSLASIYAFRMLGLFMILPILSLYTLQLTHATPTLIGLALGIYGLTQAILQIPFGMVSDRIGRKPVILFGLLLFILGSVIAALSHNIYGIIIGRALQGAGAIGSTLIALVADSTPDDKRLRAMSMIGMVIGLSFVIAMILGPLLNGVIGLHGIFWLTAGLACLSIVMLTTIPTPPRRFHRECEPAPALHAFKKVLKMPSLLRLDIGIFLLHGILMALFIAVPVLLKNSGMNQSWLFYLIILFIACLLMVPFMIIAEKKRKMQSTFLGAVIVLTLSTLALWQWHQNLIVISVLLCLFFAAFTLLEGMLPSLISKTAPPENKGTAMGIYSSAQFLGVFFGGAGGGWVFSHFGSNAIFLFCAGLGMIWIMLFVIKKIKQNL